MDLIAQNIKYSKIIRVLLILASLNNIAPYLSSLISDDSRPPAFIVEYCTLYYHYFHIEWVNITDDSYFGCYQISDNTLRAADKYQFILNGPEFFID